MCTNICRYDFPIYINCLNFSFYKFNFLLINNTFNIITNLFRSQCTCSRFM